MKPLVTVAGTALPEPSTYQAITSTIVDSGRNTAGKVIGAVVRDDVAKISMSWRYLTLEQWAAVIGPFNQNFYNEVEFLNQATGAYEKRTMYVSDRNSNLWRRDPITGDVLGWTDCKLSLVEV